MEEIILKHNSYNGLIKSGENCQILLISNNYYLVTTHVIESNRIVDWYCNRVNHKKKQ